MLDALGWFFQNIALAFLNILQALSNPSSWLDWVLWTNSTEDKESLMRFVYYGGSTEVFFAFFAVILVLTGIGVWRNSFMWSCVRVMEGFANIVGRTFAWAGLLMVLQQVVIVFIQRIFARPDISLGFGIPLQKDISWWAEALKFYNAMVVALCCTYTFVQGGHVRVDLVYSAVSHRTKRVIDMAGSILFMLPTAIIIWMYGWYFMWRHLITPKPSASDTIDRLLLKARAVRWNVETIGFSPSGFNGYFLFKVLLVVMCGLIFLQAVAFFYRSFLEWKEGEDSAGKYFDKDVLEQGEEPYDHAEF